MGKLDRLALGQEERPWPQSLIDKNELEKWQRYFCDISNVFLCAVDESGVPLTELGGEPGEAEQIERFIDGEQFQNMLQRVSESELEDRAVERTAYPNFRLAVVTSKVERKSVVNWLVCGIMDGAEDDGEYANPPLEGFVSVLSEKRFLQAVDALKAITDALLAERLFLRQAQSGRDKRAHLEQTAEEKLRRSELLREMMWLLGSSEPVENLAGELLKKTGEHLRLDIAAVYRRGQGQPPQMLAKWNKKDGDWGFVAEPKLSWPSILTAERNLILSSNTMLGDEEKEEMASLALRALITMPFKMGMEEEFWVCFGVSGGERIWELEEIRFLGEVVRILQGILAKLSGQVASKKRSASGGNRTAVNGSKTTANKRKKK